jgi:hypothetical protein
MGAQRRQLNSAPLQVPAVMAGVEHRADNHRCPALNDL